MSLKLAPLEVDVKWKPLGAALAGRIVELVDASDEGRRDLCDRLGKNRNHIARTFEEFDPEHPPFRQAFELAECLGIDATLLLSPFCQGELLEEVLAILPADSGIDRGKNPWRKTAEEKGQDRFLTAARSLRRLVPAGPERMKTPWPRRRSEEPSLGRAYSRLEEIEALRHREPRKAAKVCYQQLVNRSGQSELDVADAVRFVGLIGIWASEQRSRHRLKAARDALSLSICLARSLSDETLLGLQLQRSAFVFQDLEAPELAVQALYNASDYFRSDGNGLRDTYALIDRGILAGKRGAIERSERLFRRALEELPREDQSLYRIAATHGIANALDFKGDVKGAASYLAEAARKACDCQDQRVKAAFLVPAANIERRLGLHRSAESKYWKALRIYSERGDIRELYRTCLWLSQCLIKLSKYDSLSKVRLEMERHLPRIGRTASIRTRFECLLREISNEEVSAEDLELLDRTLEMAPGRESTRNSREP